MPKELATRKLPTPDPGQTAIVTMRSDTESVPDVHSIVKTTRGGIVRNVLTKLTLREDRGEIWFMGGYDGGTKKWNPRKSCAITASGYDRCNQFAGVSFVTPPSIQDERGNATGNPYILRKPGGTEIEYVKVRMVGIGRSALGNLIAHDVTLVYNLGTYWAQDLMSKWTRTGRDSSATGKKWGNLLPTGSKPDKECDPSVWLGVVMPAGVTLWCDLRDPEVVTCLTEHINRQKFAERNALTICRRNILKRFIAASKLDPANPVVSIVGWTDADRDMERMAELVAESQTDVIDVEGTSVEVTHDEVDAEPGEIDQSLAGDVEDDYQAADEPPATKPQAEAPLDLTKLAEAIRKKIRTVYRRLGQKIGHPIVSKHGLITIGGIDNCDDVDTLDALLADMTAADKGGAK